MGEFRHKIDVNKALGEHMCFLKLMVSKLFPNLLEKMEFLSISLEIVLGENLLTLCANLLNTNLYFRVLDLAFGQMDKQKYLGICVILAVFEQVQEDLMVATSYAHFVEILKFRSKFIFSGSAFLACIQQYQRQIPAYLQESITLYQSDKFALVDMKNKAT